MGMLFRMELPFRLPVLYDNNRHPWKPTVPRSMAKPNFVIVQASSLPEQSWWLSLHATIVNAFRQKQIQAFPPNLTRLHPDPATGAKGLVHELGPKGYIAVALLDNSAIACGGVLPFRGNNWINDIDKRESNTDVMNGEATKHPEEDAKDRSDCGVADWELCCFCVHPSHRGQGLSTLLLSHLTSLIKAKGATRLVANYAVEETGDFWPKMGFEVIPGAGGMLKKGFSIRPGQEGLREDIHFKMGARPV